MAYGPSPGCQPTPVPSNPISSAPLAWAGARPLAFLYFPQLLALLFSEVPTRAAESMASGTHSTNPDPSMASVSSPVGPLTCGTG